MAKWYRLSLSLAAKCRLGFALAVLLIIGAALYVPFRWMDKLIEQGRLELARAEVEHVLARHFRSPREMDVVTAAPPLVTSDTAAERVKPGQWVLTGERASSGQEGLGAYHVAADGDSVPRGEGVGDRAVGRWVLVADVQEHVREIQEKNATKETAPNEGLMVWPEEVFIRRGIMRFAEHPEEHEVFSAYAKARQRDGEDENVLKRMWRRAWQREPGRYLRAVRVDRSCLAGGCHAGTGEEDTEVTAEGPPMFTDGQFVGVVSVTLPEGQTGTLLLFNRVLVIVAGTLAGICAVVVFYLITQRVILRPTRLLREAADKVGAVEEETRDQGEPDRVSWQQAVDVTETIKTGDEFEETARAFGQMLTRLGMVHDRLRETNRALDTRLGELEAKNVALYESNKLKAEFLANVSHELRTPLNGILGFAEILKDRVAAADGDEKSLRYASNVLASGKLLLALINDLLDLARIEAGKVEVHWQDCALREILEVLGNLNRPQAEERELTLTVEVDEAIGVVQTDPGKLQQILFNLLSNAIKFSQPGGKVTVSARQVDGASYAVAVADTGPGIPPEDQETVFEKFRQLDGSVTREHSGTGLGLAIVKDLVDVLGGSIAVDSVVGEGATFTVTLPFRRAAEEEESLVGTNEG